MPRLRLLALLALAVPLGCGPDVDGTTPETAPIDHDLQVTIDGRVVRVTGRPGGSEAESGPGPLRILVGGGRGDERVTARVVANDVASGAYRLVPEVDAVVPGSERLAWIRVDLLGGDPVDALLPRAGVLTIVEVDGPGPGGRAPLEGVAGTFRGTFVDGADLEHEVDAVFRYAR